MITLNSFPFTLQALSYWLAIGLVSRVLFVVFTERDEKIVRIISARVGTKAEERLYNDHNNKT